MEEALTCCYFPLEHWTRMRANNVIKRLNREICRCTCGVGAFPAGNFLMPVCVRLCHMCGYLVGKQEIHKYKASEGCY